MLHGALDHVVPEEDARDYEKALAAAGIPSLLIEVPGEGHGFAVLGRKHELRPASCTVLHFLGSISAR
jgi:dipeptidyl aminopeptidase/acylaminoacyl peptidase